MSFQLDHERYREYGDDSELSEHESPLRDYRTLNVALAGIAAVGLFTALSLVGAVVVVRWLVRAVLS
jgi:hypothetical protein